MALLVPLPVWHTHEAPHFDPACPSTLQDYLYNYELLAEAAQLNLADQLVKCTHYMERDIRVIGKPYWNSRQHLLIARH